MIDEIDRKILKELQLDARTSYAELGRRVGLTTPAVIERVRKLEDAKIITCYRAEIDTAKVGLHHGVCADEHHGRRLQPHYRGRARFERGTRMPPWNRR